MGVQAIFKGLLSQINIYQVTLHIFEIFSRSNIFALKVILESSSYFYISMEWSYGKPCFYYQTVRISVLLIWLSKPSMQAFCLLISSLLKKLFSFGFLRFFSFCHELLIIILLIIFSSIYILWLSDNVLMVTS